MTENIDLLKLVKSPIISCSRRTDIPAFLMDWVLEKINQGYVDVVNPFNRQQVSRVSLSPEYVKCWVWWSKDFNKWIEFYEEHSEIFNSYMGHYFQFTINSPSELETNLKVSLEDRFEQFQWLVNNFGVGAVSFRYDPIIFYKSKGSEEVKHNLQQFGLIIEKIAGLGVKEMIFSFATLYSKVKKRMNSRGHIPLDISISKKKEIILKLKSECDKYKMTMKACCQPDLLEVDGIEQAHCIDSVILGNLINEQLLKVKDTGQRKDCGCYKSKDIGGYTGIFKCAHDCEYCYASPRIK